MDNMCRAFTVLGYDRAGNEKTCIGVELLTLHEHRASGEGDLDALCFEGRVNADYA